MLVQYILWPLIIGLLIALPLLGKEEAVLRYEILKDKNADSPYFSSRAEFKAQGLPMNTPLKLTVKRLDETAGISKAVSIDSQGRIILTKEGSEFQLGFGKLAKGEPLECILSNNDDKKLAAVKVIPYPMEVKDETGHTLSLQLASKTGEMFLLEATGFEPNELLTVNSRSESETVRMPVKASEKGILVSYLSPAVTNKANGTASVEIVGKSTKALKIDYQWGRAIFDGYMPFLKQ